MSWRGKNIHVWSSLAILALTSAACLGPEVGDGLTGDRESVDDSRGQRVPVELDATDLEKLAAEGRRPGDDIVVYRTGGSTAAGFTYRDSAEANGPRFFWMDISATGTKLNLSDDSGSGVTIPFSFPFYGTSYTNIGVGANGGLFFDGSSMDFTNSAIPATTTNGVTRHIAVYWDDLDPSQGGGVYYQVRGTTPSRKLVVQWNQVPRFDNAGDPVTVQAVLFEGSGNVLMQYLDPSLAGGVGATVGVQGSTAQGVQYLLNSAELSGGLAVCFTPTGGSFASCDLAGPDGDGYKLTDSNQPGSPQFYWQEISETGTRLSLGDDAAANINVGFSFPLYGTSYTTVGVSANGALFFDGGSMDYNNTAIPAGNDTGVQRHISVYWDDLDPSIGGGVYYRVEGSSPSRRLIVQWNKVPRFNGSVTDTVTAQAILFETSGNVLVQYLNPSSERGAGATVGIQKSTSAGLAYSVNQGVLAKRTAVCFIAPGRSSSDCSFANWLSRKGTGSLTEAQEYYTTMLAPTTFTAWKLLYGFGLGDVSAKYYNDFDLGLGRDMHCRNSGSDLACYVTNYGIAPGGPSSTALNHALSGTQPVATVAMVYASLAGGGSNAVRFYVFDKNGNRLNQVALDSEGPKNVPNVCLPCHGGTYNSSTNTVTGASFLPFDVFTYRFSTADPNYSLSSQQEAFRQLNKMIKATSPAQPIVDLIDGTYAATGGVATVGATAADTYVPPGWSGQEGIYRKVVKTSCRGCHIAQPSSVNMTSSSHLDSAQFALCTSKQMPHGEKPFKNFWTTDGPNLASYLAAAKGWSSCLDPATDSPLPASFSPVLAGSSGALINALFGVSAPSPGLPFGTFNSADTSVTATPDSGYFKILFNLGNTGASYAVSNTVIGESNLALSEWDWYRDACCFAGRRSVWTSTGWANIDSVGMGSAAAFSGKYYYRIELADVNVADSLGAFIASQGAAATVRFYGD